jgi:hypothetical protein
MNVCKVYSALSEVELSRPQQSIAAPPPPGGLVRKKTVTASTVLSFVRAHHRLDMELDLQCLFGLLCTAVLIG